MEKLSPGRSATAGRDLVGAAPVGIAQRVLGAEGLLARLRGAPRLLDQTDLLGLERRDVAGWGDRPAVDQGLGQSGQALQLVHAETPHPPPLEAGHRAPRYF